MPWVRDCEPLDIVLDQLTRALVLQGTFPATINDQLVLIAEEVDFGAAESAKMRIL